MAMVCLCHGVSERAVRRAIDHGAHTIDAIGEQTRAGTCCESCHPSLEALLDQAELVTTVGRPRRRFAIA